MAKTKKAKEPPKPHRGRVQAQGGGLDESVRWGTDSPPTMSMVLGYIDELEGKLTESEREERELGFRQIREHVRRLAAAGGMDAPHLPSFPKPPLKGGIRVDLEILAGRACVPDGN